MTSPELYKTENGQLTVSSLTIADGAGVEHKAVMQLVRTYEADLTRFGGVTFEMRPFETPGGTQNRAVAMLNEQQATLVMTYQRNTAKVREFKQALILAFFEMAQQLAAPLRELSFEEKMAEVMGTLNQRIAAQHEQLAIAAPKAAAFDAFISTAGDYSVNEAAKVLARTHQINIGQGRLFEKLEEWRWVYRQRGKPRAMQTQVDNGRMAEKAQSHEHPRTGERVLDAPQVRITAKGLAEIRERLLEAAAA